MEVDLNLQLARFETREKPEKKMKQKQNCFVLFQKFNIPLVVVCVRSIEVVNSGSVNYYTEYVVSFKGPVVATAFHFLLFVLNF